MRIVAVKRQITALLSLLILFATTGPVVGQSDKPEGWKPGHRVVMDAHNCYPYDGRWNDRITRALSAGTPLAIEQDLAWYTDPKTHESRIVVSHDAKPTGEEPTLQDYFFKRIRPLMEEALREKDHKAWPLITLNLDFKSEQPELLAAVWKLLGDYEGWLTTAERQPNISQVSSLTVGPLLVLTGDSDAQQAVFNDQVPVGQKLRVFGATHVQGRDPMAAPEILVPNTANNYRRWWNNPWAVVEAGGQQKAEEWTPQDAERLAALVHHAHRNGFWIRFYTLDGGSESEFRENGWFTSYNFGSLPAAELRWHAAQKAGVDYIATDQYEKLALMLRKK